MRPSADTKLLRRVGALALTIALATPMLAPATARATWRTPVRKKLVFTSRGYGVPLYTTQSTRGYLGAFYISPQWWTKYATNGPLSSRVAPAELARLRARWRPPISTLADGTQHVNPVTVSQQALGDYTRFLATSDRRFLGKMLAAADWLVANQKADGSWRYTVQFYDLKAGWASGMTQGQAISVLTRAYAETGNAKYLNSAKRAYAFMMKPVESGGTLSYWPDGTPFIQLYPGSTTPELQWVYNGCTFAAWGARDLWIVTGNGTYYDAYLTTTLSLARHASLYDSGTWSNYSLPSDPSQRKACSLMYHRIHIVELTVLGRSNNDPAARAHADRFMSYLVDRLD